MKPRKLSKLIYQFGAMAPTLNEFAIATALERAGLIEYSVVDGSEPVKYIETLKMRAIKHDEFNATIGAVLTEYARAHGRT